MIGTFLRANIAAAFVVWASIASALMSGSPGDDPVERPGWPAGTAAVANLQTRVGYWEGPMGGQLQFLYRGSTEEFQEAVELFAKVEAPQRLLVVEQGPGDRRVPGEEEQSPVDWELLTSDPGGEGRVEGVLAPAYEDARRRLQGAPPTLRVFVSGEGVDGVEFEKVKVPEGVTVQDKRATAHGYVLADAPVVRGRVSDITSKKGIAGAEVVLGRRDQQGFAAATTTKTDDEGRFEIKRIAPETYELRISAAGYAPRSAGYCRLGANSLEEIETGLAPAAELSGIAVDLAGKPLAGVTIRADNVAGPGGEGYGTTETHQVRTGKDGRFVIRGLPAGELQLFAYSKSHLLTDSLKRYRIPGDEITLKLVQTGRLRGKLVSGEGEGKAEAGRRSIHLIPEGGSKVGTWGGSKYVEPDGNFSFDGIPPGRYVVSDDPMGKAGKVVEIKPGEVSEVVIGGELDPQ